MMLAGQAASADLTQSLALGVESLGLAVDGAQQQQLLSYMALIQKWNKVYNLTALRAPQEILTHHVLDSLSAVGPLQRHLAQLPSAGDLAAACLAWWWPSAAPTSRSLVWTQCPKKRHSFNKLPQA
jgi:hypothetical protein